MSSSTLADAYGISRTHIVKVVQALAAAGFVRTTAGRGGGVVLARPPAEIVIGEVVRELEPSLALVECLREDGGDCRVSSACSLSKPLLAARRAFLEALDAYTLADCESSRRAMRSLLQIDLSRSPARK